MKLKSCKSGLHVAIYTSSYFPITFNLQGKI